MYDVIKYICSPEDFREIFAAMAVKAEREIESEVSSTLYDVIKKITYEDSNVPSIFSDLLFCKLLVSYISFKNCKTMENESSIINITTQK